MANSKQFSVGSFNLYNLNLPHLPMYENTKPWSEDEYALKVNWIASVLEKMASDVWGFQELWHHTALKEAFSTAGLASEYKLLVPDGHEGGRIVCAGAVRKEILVGEPSWIVHFPKKLKLEARGGDTQTSRISVCVEDFSRPVLHFKVQPRTDSPAISVYVAHLKSKNPTSVRDEDWYEQDKAYYTKHAEGLGAALSTVRRTAEAAALRMILVDEMKQGDTPTPVLLLGDLNDAQLSNTLNILTGQPRYLLERPGGGDVDLYTVGTLQEYRSLRDVYYTHIYQDIRESLDHILVSEEFYDHSRDRLWAFDSMELCNDHINREDQRVTGTSDHGVVRASFKYDPF